MVRIEEGDGRRCSTKRLKVESALIGRVSSALSRTTLGC